MLLELRSAAAPATHLLRHARHAHSAPVLLLNCSSQRRLAETALKAVHCWIQLHCGTAAAAAACEHYWLTQQPSLPYRIDWHSSGRAASICSNREADSKHEPSLSMQAVAGMHASAVRLTERQHAKQMPEHAG